GLDRNAARSEQSTYYGFYVQDDWRVTPRLTLNLGLRYEYEGPTTERFNRSVRRFVENIPNPIEPAAKVNYAAAPIPQISPDNFRVWGGLTFAGVGGEQRTLWRADRNNWGPRLGVAYSLNSRTVLRGGYVIMFDQLGVNRRSVIQTGFSQRTLIVPSLDNGLSFRADLQEPFPDGIQEAPGARLGMRTFLGRGISYFYPEPQAPRMERWMASIQRELPGQVSLEVAYMGNRGTSLETTRDVNPTPREYLSTAPFRDQAVIDFLTAQVPNPFYGIPDFTGTALAGRTVQRMQLLRPYPHFGGAVSAARPLGSSAFHSLQLRSRRRFANGWSYQAAYTWSKLIEADSFLNPTDGAPHRVISSLDRPQRVALAGIWELPFGKGKRLGGGWRGLPQLLLGGWQLQGMYNAQSGEALSFGNVLFLGNIKEIPLPAGQRSLKRWFNTEAGFEKDSRRQLAFNVRSFPLRLAGVRAPGVHALDLSLVKQLTMRERLRLEIRADLYNALNHIDPAAPETSPTSSLFGQITASKREASPRWVWVAAKLSF
ncbi:MAG: TonB-dependent receptor, partial [Bryobacteraceae bacterium]|nr:TonB-dependent receptor [Bryobacteraceae bacterium]